MKTKAKKTIKILERYEKDYSLTDEDFARGVAFGFKIAIIVIKRIFLEKDK
jgi:hypothetical protein